MQTHDLIQGSDAWDQFRLTHFGASEAAAMLGLSKKTTRNELLRMKKTGIAKEFSDWFQKNVLDHGHAVEAPARKIMEEVVGETLYPVTCSDGEISASCDGLDMGEVVAWENKQWNEEYAAMVRAGHVPEEHMPQCQQVLMVTKAEKLYFSISDGTRERTVWVEVLPDPAWFARLRAGWQQFAADLATYTPTEKVAAVVAAAPETLPAVSVRIQGSLAVASNLPDFGTALRSFINRMVPKPSTDQEFADAEAECKALKKAEEALDASESNALAELSDVDAMRRAVADLRNLARTTRLAREKIVAAEKENRRGEIVAGGVVALRDHLNALNARLGKPYMPAVSADFAGAIKGKKNLDSMQDAVDAVLANAKIAANEVADRIQVNLATLREHATGLEFLFPDTAQIVQKAPDDLTSLVKTRIADHRAAEAKKEEEQRERIRKEEAERAERELAARTAAATPPATTPSTAPAVVTPLSATPSSAPAAAPAPTVIPLPQRAQPAAGAVPTLSIGAINERLQLFTVTEAGLRGLGFEPAGRERAAPRYHEADFPHVLAAIVAHVQAIQAKQAA